MNSRASLKYDPITFGDDRESVQPAYLWEPTPDEIAAGREEHGDIADAYAVAVGPEYSGGCMVMSRYRGHWTCNPHGCRPLILHLLKESSHVS